MRSPLLLLAALSPFALHADVVLAPLFQDHAVLQHGKPVPIWGTADAGEKITLTFGDQSRSATADSEGNWSVTLDALPPAADGATLTAMGNNTVTVSDVVVGEVWIASGQSNMGWTVNNTYDQAIDVPASADRRIRHITIPRVVADEPRATFKGGKWQLADPDTTGQFTAVGYYFARDLAALLDMPVGIVNSSWGGTRVEAWMSPETFTTHPDTRVTLERWQNDTLATYPDRKAKYDADTSAWRDRKAAAEAAGQRFTERAPSQPWGPGHNATPSGLYNAMIHPLLPYAIRGAIWYQGESNAGRANEYRAHFSAMIDGWREAFGQGDFPFYWAQLSSYGDARHTSWGFLREAQTQTLALPNTGQAVIIDIGDAADIHPRNKKDVGRRLARLALKRTYDRDVIDSGPVFAEATFADGAARVTFTETHGGLRNPFGNLPGFELAGDDKVYHPAEAKIDDGAVVVTSSAVPAPVAVRYAWRNATLAGLFNREGLPAVPFRTDSW